MKKNAILFSKVDREDFWVTGGLVFKVDNTDTYKSAYEEVKDKLESDEVVSHIIGHLISDLFDGDDSFKFVKTYWDRRLFYVFMDDCDNEVEYSLSADFVVMP
jgi:hypothetical protein